MRFRYPTIGMFVTLDCVYIDTIIEFRYPTIGMFVTLRLHPR